MAYSRRSTKRSTRSRFANKPPARSGRGAGRSRGRGMAGNGVGTLRLIVEQTGAGTLARPETGSYPFAAPLRANRKQVAKR